MTVEQAMLRVGTDLYFEVVDYGEIIEEGKYDEVCETMDLDVERVEIVNINGLGLTVCRIYI